MRSQGRAVTLALVLTAVAAGRAQAQTSEWHFGPHILYNFDVKEFGVGAQFGLPIASHLEFYPSFDYYFVSPGSLWALNADLKYRFSGRGLNWLYVGSGLNLTRSSAGSFSNTDVNLNLIGGVESLRGRVHPFGEFRVIVGNGSSAQIAAGLNITLGGRHR